MRINISIALVDMVKGSDNQTGSGLCNTSSSDGEEGGGGSLDWSGTETSWVLTSFFIGYTLFQARTVHYAMRITFKCQLLHNSHGENFLIKVSPDRFWEDDWRRFMELRKCSVSPTCWCPPWPS